MKDDYLSWYKQHEDFFETLFKNDSLIFNHLRDTIKVLSYISKLDKKDVSEDLEVFYDIGFSYIFNKVNEIKYYLKHYFNNNLDRFLKYEQLINYCLYLDDLRDILVDKDEYTNTIKEGFADIHRQTEEIINKKKIYNVNKLNDFDTYIQSLMPTGNYLTIPEIFQRAAEELQL